MGFAQFMVSSMKSNSRRQQRVPFDKENIYLSSNDKKKKPQFKKATQEQLLKIKERLHRSNNVYQRKLIGFTVLITITVLTIITYSLTIIEFSI